MQGKATEIPPLASGAGWPPARALSELFRAGKLAPLDGDVTEVTHG